MLLARVFGLGAQRRSEARISEEIETHLDLLTEQHIARGLAPGAARAAARREFGGVDRVKETYRDQRGLPALETIAQDVRYAARMLRKDRRFTIATVLALGLGVGAVNAVFAVLNTTMIRELPFPDADRLVSVRPVVEGRREGGLSYAEYLELRRRVTAFDGVGGTDNGGGSATIVDVGGGDTHPPERVRRTWATANLFTLLRTSPVLGRAFRDEDDLPGAPSVAVLSHDFWRWRYGSDPDVIGRAVTIDGLPATIVGVMPPAFTYPLIAQLWQPLGAAATVSASGRDRRSLGIIARLRPGSTLAQARAELEVAIRAMPAAAARQKPIDSFDSRMLKEEGRGGRAAAQVGLALMALAVLVLVIACANVAGLLLARSMTRAREMAIRAAVGATRWRIVRQILIECLVLASLAGAVGAVLSRYGARLLATGFDVIEPGMPNVTPYWVDLSMDASAYLFVAVVCLCTTIGFGLGPALHTSGANANETLKHGRYSGGRTTRWTGILVAAEIALTLVLLTSAGLMWRTFVGLYRADLVVETSRLTTMRLTLPGGAEHPPSALREFFMRLNDRLASSRRLPSATMASNQVIGSPGATRQLAIAGRPTGQDGKAPTTQYLSVGDRFFDTVKLPLVRGRALEPGDGDSGREAAVVNERFVALFSPNEDPVGRRIQLIDADAKGTTFPWLTIVGISRTVPSPIANIVPQPVVYVPFLADPLPQRSMTIVVADTALPIAASVLREEVQALQPGLAVYAIEPLGAAVARGRMAQHLLGTWLGILAVIALVLTSVGLYALTAHSVVQRTQEIGVRMALGAPRARVLWLFLRRSLTHVLLGVTLGLGGALFAGRLFGQFLLHGGTGDLTTVSIVTIVLMSTAAAASLLPASRASRIDPIVALRHD